MQLEAFLSQRLTELDSKGNVLASSQFQSAPASVQIDEKLVVTMATEVRNIIGQLTSAQIQPLMLIRNSPRYFNGFKRLKFKLKTVLLFSVQSANAFSLQKMFLGT